MHRPAVVVFDVNETLSDMAPLAQRFTQVGAPPHLAQTWFAAVLRDGFGLAAAGAAAPFGEIARSVLRGVLTGAGIDDVEHGVEHIVAGFLHLDLHPDVSEAMRALQAEGLRLVTLTNGSTGISEALFERGGVRDVLERLLSVEDAGVWKPARAAYEYAARVCEVPLHEMLMVAVHPWDIDGAARSGMHTAWIDRSGAPYPAHATPPQLVAGSMSELAAQLLDESPRQG